MQQFCTMTVLFTSDLSQENMDKINEVLLDTIGMEMEEPECVVIEECYDLYDIDAVSDMLREIALYCPDISFTVTNGIIDASRSCGEYMAFDASYSDHQFVMSASDWYFEFYESDYETYEEFHEAFGDEYSEAEYEKFLDSGEALCVLNGKVVHDIPKTEIINETLSLS